MRTRVEVLIHHVSIQISRLYFLPIFFFLSFHLVALMGFVTAAAHTSKIKVGN